MDNCNCKTFAKADKLYILSVILASELPQYEDHVSWNIKDIPEM